jgi:hypothetical protein
MIPSEVKAVSICRSRNLQIHGVPWITSRQPSLEKASKVFEGGAHRKAMLWRFKLASPVFWFLVGWYAFIFIF